MTDGSTATEARSGDYVALCAISKGRFTTGKEGDRRADLVMPGEPLRLTDDEAAYLQRGHRVPVVARKDDREGQRRVIAQQLMNPMRPAAAFEALPEEPVKGTVTILDGEQEPVSRAPEATLARPGDTDPDFGAEGQRRRPGRPAGK